MFDTLLDLPLFRGVSRERITETIEKSKFHFLKYHFGEKVINTVDECASVCFVLSGEVKTTLEETESGIKIIQTFKGPEVLFPEFLFGPTTYYPLQATALSNTSILKVGKSDFLSILASDSIYLLNYLNYLSGKAQNYLLDELNSTNGSEMKRIAARILGLTSANALRIRIEATDVPLYEAFGEKRENFYAVLAQMKDKGIIDYNAKVILVKNRKELAELLANGNSSCQHLLRV